MDDIKIHVQRKNQDVLQAVLKVASKLKSVLQKAKLKLQLTEGGKERRKEQAHCLK